MFVKIQYKGSVAERQTFPWACWFNHQYMYISAANLSVYNFPLILSNFLETKLS